MPCGEQSFLSGGRGSQGDFRQETFIVISPKPLRPNRGLSQFAFSSKCMVSAGIWAGKQVCYREPDQVSPVAWLPAEALVSCQHFLNRGGLNSSLDRCGENELPQELLTLCSFKRMRAQRAEMP